MSYRHLRSLRSRIQRRAILATALASFLGLMGSGAQAQLNWDPTLTGTATGGGTGTWDATTANWWDGIGDAPWVANSNAIFGGSTAGTVTVGSPISASALTFNTTGYTLTGTGNVLSLTGPGNITAGTGVTATIDTSVLDLASNITANGAGTIILNGTSLRTGSTTISSGTLKAALTSASNPLGTGALNLSGGTLDLTPVANVGTSGLTARTFGTVTAFGDTSLFNFRGTAASTSTYATLQTPATIPTNVAANTGIQWTGKLKIVAAGDYNFLTSSDDGSRVFIDGVLVLNNDGPKGLGTANTSGLVNLTAGLHDIRVDYVQGGGGSGMNLLWRGNTAGLDAATTAGGTIIPTTSLFTAESASVNGASNAVVVGTGLGNALNVSNSSTINLNGGDFTSVQFGATSLATGSTLNVTGLAGKTVIAAGPVTLGSSAGTVTFNGTPNISLDGVVSDGGNVMTVVKQGTGRLIFNQNAAANTLTAGTTLDIQGGSVVAVGSAVGTFNPIGAATVSLNGGDFIIDTSAGGVTYNNTINLVAATGKIQNVANATTTTLSGPLSVGANALTIDAIGGGNPATDLGATVALTGPLTGSGSLTATSTVLTDFATAQKGRVVLSGSITGFTGVLGANAGGVLVPNGTLTGFTGTFNAGPTGTIQPTSPTAFQDAQVTLSGGALNLLFDGNGTATPQAVVFNDDITVTGNSTISVNRSGTAAAPNFPLAVNKTAQLDTLSIGAQSLTVTNNNGYGVAVNGTTTLTGAATFNVGTASAPTAVQGLTLDGVVSGAFGITKTGPGTMVLTNPANTFGTGGSVIDLQGGFLSAASDAVLGDSGNVIRLNGTTASPGGLRATGTFAPARSIELTAVGEIDVTSGNTVTLNNAFGGTLSGTTQLIKGDSGTLVLNAANSGTWTGSITAAGAAAQVLTGGLLVNGGVVKITNPAALGATTNIVAVNNNSGAAVQIDGGITVPNPLVLNTLTTNAYAGGINWTGQLRSTTGSNVWSGAISANQDAGITADAGSTLQLSGGINQNAHIVVYGGAGNINVTTNPITAVHSLDKIGSGTVNIQVSTAAPTGNGIRVFGGTLVFSGASGSVPAGGTITTLIAPGGTLTLDNSTNQVNSRLGGRIINFQGGNFNLIGAASGVTAVTEATLAPTFSRGQTVITVTAGTGGANLAFGAASNNVSPAQNAATGPSGASVLFRGTSLGSAAGAGVSTIQSTTGGLLFNGQTGATGTTTKGIMPWALVDASETGVGTSFATGDAAAAAANTVAIVRPLAASEYSNTTGLVANTNALINTTSGSITGATTVTPNSLTFDNSTSLGLGAFQTVTLSSGGILVRNGSTTTISGGILAQPAANAPWNIHTPGTADLTISSLMTGGNSTAAIGLVKGDGGTLTLSTPKLTIPGVTALNNLSANTLLMQTVVNSGTLKLNGGTNALGGNNYLAVGAGATLDLNGNSQYVLGLFTDGTFNGIPGSATAGGTISNSAATQATLVVNTDARNWAGQITGNISYNKTGNATQTVYQPQTYTGPTLINSGTLTLRDAASLPNTSSISLNYGTLNFDNTQAAFVGDRVTNTTPINLSGGAIVFNGRVQTDATETLGVVTLVRGNSNINVVNPAVVGSTSTTLTLNNIVQGSIDAVTNLQGAGGNLGNTSRLMLATPPTLVNGIMSPWIQSAAADFVTYSPTYGIVPLNGNGGAGYTGAFPGASDPTANVKLTAAGNIAAANLTINVLHTQANAVTFGAATNTLNLGAGGLMHTGATSSIGATADSGRVTAGDAATGIVPFYVHNGANTLTMNSRIVNNAAGGQVRLIYNNYNGGLLALAAPNTYTGGTVVNGWIGGNAGGLTLTGGAGVVTIPAGGLTINNSAVTMASNQGQIDPSNVVTLTGGSTLTLIGNNATGNTLAGLVFDNVGGAANPTVNTFTPAGATNKFTGVLTIGASGIVASSQNVAFTSTIAGRTDFGATPNTIVVNPIQVNGVNVAPLQASLAIQGIVNSAGGITKSGDGVLQLNAQQTFTGPLTVTAGGVNIGLGSATGLAANAQGGSRFSALTLNAGTWLNLNAQDATIGSLAGSGTVINQVSTGALATGKTLNVGFDNTSTTFSGSFARYSDALVSSFQVNKIGTGTMTLTGNTSTNSGNLQVSQGGVTFSGAGVSASGTVLVASTGTLTLDNSGTNITNRLGGPIQLGTTATASILGVVGGEFRLIGNAAAPTSETVGTLTINSGTNPSGPSTITLLPNAAQSTTLTASTSFPAISGPATGLIRGISGTAAAGNGNVNIGALALGAQTGAGTGTNGLTTMPIRPDLLGDASSTGSGTGFITKDSATNFLRPLTSAELNPTLYSGITGATTTATNYGLSTSLATSGRTIVGSLTLQSGGGAAIASGVSTTLPEGLPIGLAINTGGVLAFAGNTNLNVPRLETLNNATLTFHTLGNLTTTATLFGTTGGMTKADAGSLTLSGGRSLYTGNTNVNGGTLILNAGANTLPVLNTTAGGATTAGALGVQAGATVDLNGNNQIVGTFFSNAAARYSGSTGTVTNTSATSAIFTTNMGTAQPFAGSINGNLSLNKTGNNALTLTGPNNYTGATNVRANTLQLIDGGTLSGTSGVNLLFGGLNIDQSGLNPLGNLNPTRLAATVPVNMTGGTLTLTAGGSADSTATINTVNAQAAHNTIAAPQAPVSGIGVLTLGNLQRGADATVNFTGGNGATGFFTGSPGYNNSQVIINQINGSAVTLTNKILGGWAITNNGEFTTYVKSTDANTNGIEYGIVTLNGPAALPQTAYDSSAATFPASNAASNVRMTATAAVALPAGNTNYNVLAVRAATPTITFAAAGNILNLTAGGLALTNGGTTVGGAANSGIITAGGVGASGTQRLYVYTAGATNTINSVIADNSATAPVRLIITPTANTLNLAGNNTYTGGTVINGAGGTVTLTAASGIAIPAGGLTINNTTLTSATASGSIAASNDVTLNGGGVLVLGTAAGTFTNTLSSLTFNNIGGTANPSVQVLGIVGASLTLTSPTPITAVNDNVATIPTISGTAATSTLIFAPSSGTTSTISTSSTVGVPTDLVISAMIATAPSGGLIKAGTGSLLLSNTASTFANGLAVNSGSLVLGASSTPTTGTVTSGPIGVGGLTLAGGTSITSDSAIRTIANAVTLNGDITFGALNGDSGSAVAVNGVILSGPVALGTGVNRTINVNSHLNVSTISGIASGTGTSITKIGPGTLALTGVNTYDGGTNINGGTLQTNATGIGSTGTVTFGGGILQHAASTTTDFSARISTANNQPIYIDTNGNTATYATALTSATGGSLGKFGTGTLILTATANYDGITLINGGALQIGAGGTTGAIPVTSNILNNGVFQINRGAAETITHNGTITGGGGITIDQATFLPTNTVNLGGNLNFGSAVSTATIGTLDLTSNSATFGGLNVLTNNATGNTIIVGNGQTLNINGNVVIGPNPAAAGQTTKLTVNGGGAMVVNTPAGGLFQVGGSTGANSLNATLDVTALNTLTVNVSNTGTFRVNNPTANNVATQRATMLFPTPSLGITTTTPVTTITAGTFAVGDLGGNNNGAGQINSAVLGSGLTTINANTINIGSGFTGTVRDIGSVTYSGTATNGVLKVRAADGVSAAAFNMGAGGTTVSTGVAGNVPNVFNVTGHNADLLFSTMTVGNQSRNSNVSSVFSFDTGTLVADGVQLGFQNAAAGTSAASSMTSTINWAGGTVTIGTGGIDMATNLNTTTALLKSTTAALNVSGGTVTVANNPTIGGALRLYNNTGANNNFTPSSGTATFTGGTTTLNGDIIIGANQALQGNSGTVVLNGGTLSMAGNKIGTSAAPVTFTAQSGTLNAVGEINGGGVVDKTTAGTLTYTGLNNYTGATTVTGGKLLVNGTLPRTSTVTVSTGATLGGSGTIGNGTLGAVTVASGGFLSPGNSPGNLTFATGLNLATGSTFQWELNAPSEINPGTDWDRATITGGVLTVGAGVNFVPSFTGTATTPAIGGFWNTNHTWNNVFNVTGGTISGIASNFTIDNSAWTSAGTFAVQTAATGSGFDLVWNTAFLGTGPDIGVTPAGAQNIFVLQNASLSTAVANVTITNGNAATGTIDSITTSDAVLTASNIPSAIGASPASVNSTISLTSTATTKSLVNAVQGQVTFNTTPTDASTANNTALVNVRIGNAPLAGSATSVNFGSALTAATPANNITPPTYTNLSSNTLGTINDVQLASVGSPVKIGTTATILNYTNGTLGDSGIVSMQWRTRTAAESGNTETLQGGGTNSGGLPSGYLISDVVNITGMDNGSGFTDKFVLQMTYDASLLNGFEAEGIARGSIFIGWKNGGTWVNAVLGNSVVDTNNFSLNYKGVSAPTNTLGDYGVLPGPSHTVWAVLDHNSEFAVIPEPSTFVLGGLALLGFAGVGLRKRRMAKQDKA